MTDGSKFAPDLSLFLGADMWAVDSQKSLCEFRAEEPRRARARPPVGEWVQPLLPGVVTAGTLLRVLRSRGTHVRLSGWSKLLYPLRHSAPRPQRPLWGLGLRHNMARGDAQGPRGCAFSF